MRGYYRFPAINKDTVIFVSEDDLWTVPADGGIARRLTSNLGKVSYPYISPDGKFVAFIGTEEGHTEVYYMPVPGGIAKRLTFIGANSRVVGWSKDSKKILFSSNYRQPFSNLNFIYSVSIKKDIPKLIKVGSASQISYGPSGRIVIGRNTADPARWKRYRGGTVGDLWIDPGSKGKGDFKKLINLNGNLAAPMCIGRRIYFISDHEGVGNIYSCTPAGKNLKRHTHNTEFYVRNAVDDKKRIVFQSGADIFIYDPAADTVKEVGIQYHSPRVQTNRKFVKAADYLEDYSIHPEGKMVSVTTRGKVFTMTNWSGPVTQHGQVPNCRYRLGRWLHDGKRFVVVTDERGEEILQMHYTLVYRKPVRFPLMDLGRPIELEPSPKKYMIVLTNHRFELILVDLVSKKKILLDKSRFRRITGVRWSGNGQWITYSFPDSERTSCIKVCNVANRKTYVVTRTVMRDFAPCFDPDGKYLFFLSNRELNPVYDTIQFELSFPANIKPYLITLRKGIHSPFKYTKPLPRGLTKSPKDIKITRRSGNIVIDFDGIKDRIIPFPVLPARYRQIWSIKGKLIFTTVPVIDNKSHWASKEVSAKGLLQYFSFKDQKIHVITRGVSNFKIAQRNDVLIYRAKNFLRIIKPVENVYEKLKTRTVGFKGGWLDLSRIKVMVEPGMEWRQMYRDAWKLQRDHFWTKNMSGIAWRKVFYRYLPLLGRIGTRSEFSDLIWEMQGELGTSHAYELGGDYRKSPQYKLGFLGADFQYDKKHNAYRIAHITKGDPWDANSTSPLLSTHINAKKGDLLFAINRVRVGKNKTPEELLVNSASTEISITISDSNGKNIREVSLKTLKTDIPARYRDWVEFNRNKIHRVSKNKIGYVHIPDMGPAGFAEFHRYFLTEIQYPALIVDVRFNRGGHISELLLEKLARRRVGYDISRWKKPKPYPVESVLGPIVCITNEYAGSDGDIFSHAFKLYGIGPLIGKRTWGGVIGISPYYRLSDGGLTTQPEFSFWFTDVGWNVENHGADPDIEVEITPEDYIKGNDPQLSCAIKECTNLLKKNPPKIPKFKGRPKLKIPVKL